LPANQGFAVRATSGTNSMNIPTDSKLHNAQAFRKAGLNDRSYISLTLIDNIGKTNDLFYLNFDDDASDEYDNGLDAYEFVSGVTAANLSAKLNGDYLSMLGVPLHTGTQVYPLYILKGEDIEYTIGIDELMAIENMEIVLEDIQTGEFITLDESTSYTFIVNEGDDNNRFNLHLKNATAVQDLESELPFAIYSANSSICIMNSESKKYEVLVYDISGRLIYQDSAVSSNFNKIDIDTVEGVYLVKILSEGQAITRKIIK